MQLQQQVLAQCSLSKNTVPELSDSFALHLSVLVNLWWWWELRCDWDLDGDLTKPLIGFFLMYVCVVISVQLLLFFLPHPVVWCIIMNLYALCAWPVVSRQLQRRLYYKSFHSMETSLSTLWVLRLPVFVCCCWYHRVNCHEGWS